MYAVRSTARNVAWRRAVVLISLLFNFSWTNLIVAAGVNTDADSAKIFERFSDLVVQIRVVEAGSGAKASIGSGFVVSPTGKIATNFHVIADIIHHPERYRAEFIDAAEQPHPLTILAINVIHDLAIVKTDHPFKGHFQLDTSSLAKGVRLFSLGNPYDLGLAVVEGTYNGLLEHSLWKKIHFTGSINPGMSGGPVLSSKGRVVGVNVATSGNQVSFLVPVIELKALLEQTDSAEFNKSKNFIEEIRTQLLDHQEQYLSDLFTTPIEKVQLGDYEVPGKLSSFFDCWGDRIPNDDDLFDVQVHQCDTDDRVFISRKLNSSVIFFRHRQLRNKKLGATAFYQLYSAYFESNYSSMPGTEEDFSPFRCRTKFIKNNDLTFKTTFCVRRYRDFEGLYDAVFKAAVLGDKASGLETALVLSAVSFENAQRLSRLYLEAIRWKK